MNNAKTPFFKVFLTLSSHEPFEVPTKYFKGTEDTPRFLNSMMYTDSCIGDFIDKARQQTWWKDTWIIFVADHGSYHPEKLKVHVPKKFYIPMIWTGGAIAGSMKFDKTASQADIPAMLLYQLGCKFDQYRFSRNVFGDYQKTDAFYLFNNGIGMVNDTSKLVFDCTRQSLMLHYGGISDSLVNISKAYIQTIYSDLNKR
jgi:phosphoglycerol transferase MdoB-like AlkP superfamily enzyme